MNGWEFANEIIGVTVVFCIVYWVNSWLVERERRLRWKRDVMKQLRDAK